MTERRFRSLCIALEQIETALRLFASGEDYFSIITLAGAAEEIFGKACRSKGIKNSLGSIKDDSSAMYKYLYGTVSQDNECLRIKFAKRANRAKNKIKHVNPELEPIVTLDPLEEAKDMLNRAIDNYWNLEHGLTPAMDSFIRRQLNLS